VLVHTYLLPYLNGKMNQMYKVRTINETHSIMKALGHTYGINYAILKSCKQESLKAHALCQFNIHVLMWFIQLFKADWKLEGLCSFLCYFVKIVVSCFSKRRTGIGVKYPRKM
jgi:hypothetical protein